MALKGISALLKVSTTSGGAGVYTTVAEISEASISIDGQNIDVSFFGTSAWSTRIQGRKDVSITFSGNLVPGDTLGQIAIQSALLGDSELWAQFLPNGVAGFKAQFRVGNWSAGAEVNGIVSCSGSLEGTSAVSLV